MAGILQVAEEAVEGVARWQGVAGLSGSGSQIRWDR